MKFTTEMMLSAIDGSPGTQRLLCLFCYPVEAAEATNRVVEMDGWRQEPDDRASGGFFHGASSLLGDAERGLRATKYEQREREVMVGEALIDGLLSEGLFLLSVLIFSSPSTLGGSSHHGMLTLIEEAIPNALLLRISRTLVQVTAHVHSELGRNIPFSAETTSSLHSNRTITTLKVRRSICLCFLPAEKQPAASCLETGVPE
jgi:hypothetical protein